MLPRGVINGLYAIVDDSFAGPAGLADRVLAAGCRLIQLRCKKMSTADFLKTASDIRAACSAAGASFIVNDRVDIAMAAGADGVHLGQKDLPIAEARRIMGRGKIIGISTNNMGEALAAQDEGADYIGFGPVFRTATKGDAREVRGIEALSEVARSVSIPVVAIGGINLENVESVFAAGAAAAALVSEIARAEDVAVTTSRLINMRGKI